MSWLMMGLLSTFALVDSKVFKVRLGEARTKLGQCMSLLWGTKRHIGSSEFGYPNGSGRVQCTVSGFGY